MIHILFWNCRGIANHPTRNFIRLLIKKTDCDLIALAEPKATLDPITMAFFDDLGYASSPTSQKYIWLLQKKSSPWTFQPVSSSRQYIFTKGTLLDMTIHISCIYASTRVEERRPLWHELLSLGLDGAPWCILGDFNAILVPGEKYGRRPPSPTSINDFNNFVLDCKLVSPPFSGPSYTWTNRRRGSNLTMARLDRCFFNTPWLLHMGASHVAHHPRISSDHNPISLSSHPHGRPKRPFRFEAFWLEHPDFMGLVSRVWATPFYGTPMFILKSKLMVLKKNLRKWNHKTFGCLQKSIKNANDDLVRAQETHDSFPNDSSAACLEEASARLADVLHMERIMWQQRAKAK